MGTSKWILMVITLYKIKYWVMGFKCTEKYATITTYKLRWG